MSRRISLREALPWAAAVAAVGLGLVLWLARPSSSIAVTVFAAVSLQEVVTDALRDAGLLDTTRVAFAASSTLARQIEAGAPADIFISANTDWVDYLAAKSLVRPASRRRFAGNRLVLVASAASALQAGELADIPRLLGADGRLAMGDPEHVPAGIYARDALRSAGVWASLERRVARADSVRAALALVTAGSAPLAIVYLTDAGVAGDFDQRLRALTTVDPALHRPIVYQIVEGAPRTLRQASGAPAGDRATARSGVGAREARAQAAQAAATRAVWQALTGPPARDALRRYGFTP